MSRVTKWKLEKTKVKVVFRLQFHATHVPQAGWDKLFISFIPVDSGKAIAKTTKANVRNGTCKWGDPIYETTRLLQDTKTKQYDEKLYKLVVTMGSSRSSVLGETNINLADYADASKPSAVALPLHGCDSETVLHVTVQLLTSKTGFREFEQQRELRESGLRSTSDQNRNDISSARRISSSEDTGNGQIDKMNAGVKFKELSPLEEEVGLNEEYADSTVGFDGSSNTSESLYAEKHDTSSGHEVDSLKSATSADLGGLPRSQSPGQEKRYSSDQRFLAQGTNEWPHGWGSDYSADADLSNSYDENNRLRGSLEAAESSILELKQEVSSLQNHADEIGIEAQKFSLQLDAEIASGERLAKEVSILRSECSKLKEDIDKQKSSKLSIPFTNRKIIERGQDHFFQELQLRWFKGISDVEDRIRELQSKACFGVHERDSQSLHSDFYSLLGALQVLKQETGEANSGTGMISAMQNDEICLHKGMKSVIGTRFGADFYQPEGALHSLNMPGVVSQDFESIDAVNAMKGKVFELLRELEEVKTDREILAKKADQMECYYEALIQELEENQRQMMGELQNLRNEHSTCLYTIASDKAEMERIQQDMTNERIRFSTEQRDLDSLNKELERRATTAEAAVKRARMNYSIAVDQLQKDLEVLSFQVVSMYETNESLIKQAFADSLLPRFQDCEESMQNQKLNSVELHTTKDLQCQNPCNGIMNKHLDGDTLSDELRRSLILQRRLYQKVEEELYEVHLANVHLDVFSKTLQATLFEASADFGLTKEKVHELSQQLAHSTESNELLMLRLQAALDEIRCLNEYKDTCDMNYNDLALKNQILEANLQKTSSKNDLFTQKISEWKRMIKEYEIYQSKYTACTTEKLELANSLEKEILENGTLQNRVSTLEEELRSVRTDFDKLADVKEDQQNIVKFLQGKLWNLLASYDQMYKGLSLCNEDFCKDLESKDLTGVVSQIEELQHNINEKIVQLMEEKKDLAQKRDIVQESLSAAESYNLVMKQKFEHDLRGMMDELDFSNALVQKLQLQVEAIAKRSEMSSKDEENYAQQHKELLSDLDHLERELQQLTSRSQALSEEFMATEKVTEELGRCNVTMAALSEEKEALLVSLQDKTEASSKLALELNNVQASLLSLHDELQIERNLRDKLEITVTDLTSQLEEKHTQLLGFGQQNAELIHLKQLVSDLELEKSRVSRLLLDSQESLKDARETCSSVSLLEDQLFEMDEYSIAADIGLIFTTTQYQSRIEELGKCNLTIAALTEEKTTLMVSLQDKTEESSKILLELSSLQGSLQSLHDELQIERHLKESLESTVTDLTSQLDKKNCRLLDFDHHQDELGQLKQLVSDLELEKSRIHHLLLDSEECLKGVREECSSIPALEAQLSETQEFSVAADVELTFIKTQYKAMVEELVQELHFSDSQVSELRNNHLDLETKLTHCLAGQRGYLEENTKLMTSLKSLNSELEASCAQNRILLDTNSAMRTELEEYQKRAKNMEGIVHMDKSRSALEIERLEHVLMTFEEEINNLIIAKEELEVKVLVIKAKLDERCSQITLLEGYKDEIILLHDKCSELSERLAEQVLKTEEFKNLSIHFKELKEKAYAEGLHAHDKREVEGPPAAAQESLRIAFIKEQYETKLQELKQQLAMSKKHSEEMLWKLQDAINELENRKKFEATYTKRNEELGMRILELESDLHSVLSEKREMMKAYDLMKAEKECSLISLECCKEEKQELEASLQKCDEEKVRIALELNSVKELLDSSSSSTNHLKEGNDILQKSDCISERFRHQDSISGMQNNCMTEEQLDDETDQSNVMVHSEQDNLRSGGANGTPSVVHSKQKDALNSDMKHLVLANEHFKGQSLKSSMENLNKELERMKHENLLLPLDDHHFDPNFPGLQRELMQLNKVNEELGSIFPLFNEFSCSGNALERVLALEVELAEALQTKKKSVVQFQSSFLRQHSDEEAVFHSFRDINELIKDMLEIKGRYATVETELREMHDRYSQLSLQFAEVEGERQKLMMTLKNVRASKKALGLNRSSTGTFLDPS